MQVDSKSASRKSRIYAPVTLAGTTTPGTGVKRDSGVREPDGRKFPELLLTRFHPYMLTTMYGASLVLFITAMDCYGCFFLLSFHQEITALQLMAIHTQNRPSR